MAEQLQLTALEIRKRLAAGDRVCLLSKSGALSRILGVEDPVGGTEEFKVMFKGFMTGMDLTLDVVADRKLDVVTFPPAEGES